MNRRERLRRAYFHQEMDRPAVYVRRGFPSDDPTYDELRGYIDERTDIKLGWSARSCLSKPPVEDRIEPHNEDFERRVRVVVTPLGELTASRLASLKGEPGLAESHLLENREDAEKYLSLPLPEFTDLTPEFVQVEKEVGDRGIAEVSLGLNPAAITAELFGSEAFAMHSVTDRELVESIMEREMQVLLELVKRLLGRGLGPYFSILGQEYIVPPLHGPHDFRDFNVRYDKPVLDLVHEAGGRVHVHSHGSIKKVFDGFIELGADVLHPIEPPPMGDLPLAEAKELARGRLTLEGNIQIADMYEKSPENIRQQTTQAITDAFGDHRGLIVCPTASPYLRGRGGDAFPRFKAMIDTVLAWEG